MRPPRAVLGRLSGRAARSSATRASRLSGLGNSGAARRAARRTSTLSAHRAGRAHGTRVAKAMSAPNVGKMAGLGKSAKQHSRKVTNMARNNKKKVAMAAGAAATAGAVIRSTGKPVDRQRGRPTGMYGY